MKIIISPAKKMRINETMDVHSSPLLKEKSAVLLKKLQSMSFDELKSLYKANDKITLEALHRWERFSLDVPGSPALFSYDGIQYTYMRPNVFTSEMLDYAKKHLFILSGFYGILGPFDGVLPYRLEMNNPLHDEGYRSLYEFWGSSLHDELYKNEDTVINLCSEEYGTIIRRHLKKDEHFVEVHFYEDENGTLSEKGVYCKMARGLMTSYLASLGSEHPEDMKHFNDMGYVYQEQLSSPDDYIFSRRTK